MRTPLRARVKRRIGATLAVLAGAGMLLTGLPGIQEQAVAAPALKGKRCDELHLGRKFDAPIAGAGIPGKNQQYSTNPESDWGDYFVDNPSHSFDGLKAPSPAQAKLAGKLPADIEKWKAKYKETGNIKYRVLEIYARYGQNIARNNSGTIRDFRRYMDVRIIGNEFNRLKGNSFESRLVRKFQLVGPDWLCQVEVPVTDKNGKPVLNPKTGKQVVRVYDAYNAKTKELGEFKSNGKHIAKQFRVDKQVLRSPAFRDHSLRLITGEKTSNNTLKQYRALNAAIQRETGRSNGVTIREQRANAVPRWQPNQYTRYNPTFNPSPSRVGTGGPLDDAAYRSGRTPEEARNLQRMYQGANTRGGFGRPGGVDFSSLELNYVGNPVKGKGIDYSFKSGYVPDEDTDPGFGGQTAVQLASDSFFTWLALSPDRMWVNLNPDDPATVMDDGFAHTDAGRILLEADMEMKRDFSRAIDYKTPSGKQLWDQAEKIDGAPCLHSIRNWITPKSAKVREQDGGVYILDAPLRVQSTPQEFSTQPSGGSNPCTRLTDEQIEHNQRLIDQYIVPVVEKQINADAKYKDLRTVYRSRVAAEWVRAQDLRQATDFRPIINSNNLKRWPLRAPNQNWDKMTVWRQMVKSFREGEVKFEIPVNGQPYIYSWGGVDFSKAPKRNVTRLQFGLENPRLDSTTKTSVKTETAYRDTETAYLGGSGTHSAPGGDDDGTPTPTPSPTPTGSGKPTSPPPSPTPSTPAPEPSVSQSGSHTPAPQGGGNDDDGGGLADTGTQVLTASAIAAALLAAGTALMWWKRRRTTGSS
ncbi:LPXTG cell wall anchor domain-containing protein [Streptomyces sp. NPDC050619]|uniref:LPXTG cell wall anchor domain-containing protein n=1 Tax=Streptomyces sp. NPDC050619 TaxID=3157214 RepID=UPI0034382C8E